MNISNIFIGPTYTSRSTNVNAQETLNLYPEVDESGKNVIALYGTPGLTTKATATAAAVVRGMLEVDGTLYAVSGAKLYKYTTGYVETELGSLNTSTGVVSMAANRTQLCVVDGTDGYIVTLSSGAFAVIADADFPAAPQRVVFIDGYFLVNDANTQRFYISSPDDGTAWDALDFASAEGAPDDIVSMLADHRELWVFGEETTEVWANAGNADFPFMRITGAFIETGCAASHSVAKMDNSVFWLATDKRGDGVVMRADGYTPKRISTHAIEFAIQNYSTISDAIGWTQQQEGHSFYWLTFPTGNATWVYDAATGLWHRRAYRNPGDGSQNRHRANCYAFFNRTHLVGDHTNGKIYELDLDVYADAGDTITALRRSGHIADKDEQRFMFHHRMQVDIEAGIGLGAGQGSDPQIMLRWSDDGGHSWSNYHYADVGSFAALGALGEYRRRAIWYRLGQSRDRIYEVSITDPIKRVLVGANLRASKGGS